MAASMVGQPRRDRVKFLRMDTLRREREGLFSYSNIPNALYEELRAGDLSLTRRMADMFAFEPKNFKSFMSAVSHYVDDPVTPNFAQLLRIMVLEGTLNALEDKRYFDAATKEFVALPAACFGSAADTQMADELWTFEMAAIDREFNTTKFTVQSRVAVEDDSWNSDTDMHFLEGCPISATILTKQEGKNDRPVLILEVESEGLAAPLSSLGSSLKVEELRRRSNLTLMMQQKGLFPLTDHGTDAVYLPDVCIFRDGEADGYAFCEPKYVTVILCVVPQLPKWRYDTRCERVVFTSKVFAKRLESAIKVCMDAAKSRQHDCIVFHSIGVNANARIPPSLVAEAILEVLLTKFPTAFADLVVCITEPVFDEDHFPGTRVSALKDFMSVMVDRPSPYKVINVPDDALSWVSKHNPCSIQ